MTTQIKTIIEVNKIGQFFTIIPEYFVEELFLDKGDIIQWTFNNASDQVVLSFD